MNNSMISSSVSMQSLQQKLDLLANNMSNIDTVGFKKQEASFKDVLTNVKQQPTGFKQQGRMTPLGFTQGWGTQIASIKTNLAQGPLKETDDSLDFALEGDGFFEVGVPSVDANGQQVLTPAWTRSGAFKLQPQKDGTSLVLTEEGYAVLNSNGQPIAVPSGQDLLVDASGKLRTKISGSPDSSAVEVGSFKLMRTVNANLLQSDGQALYTLPNGVPVSDALEQVDTSAAASAGELQVRQGFLEESNVDMAEEMTELLVVQRAFQLNAKALTSADTMAGMAYNLRG